MFTFVRAETKKYYHRKARRHSIEDGSQIPSCFIIEMCLYMGGVRQVCRKPAGGGGGGEKGRAKRREELADSRRW